MSDHASSEPDRPVRLVRVGTSFSLTATAPTWTFLRVRPAAQRRLEESFRCEGPTSGLQPATAVDNLVTGADVQLVDRVLLPTGVTRVTYDATVEVSGEPDVMPDDLAAPAAAELTPDDWWWLQPTRYCRPDELGAEAWALFGAAVGPDQPATGSIVRAICSHVDDSMRFSYGSSTPLTSATDAWAARTGVCRDFNHIAVSFCRALNIPARYVFGYLPDLDVAPSTPPMDFSAWFEAYLGGRWWTFDARVNRRRIGRIVIGRGRDAADVPMVSTLGPVLTEDFEVTAVERAALG